MQAGRYPTVAAAVRHAFARDGVAGLYNNGKLVSQIMRDVPYAVLTLLTYEALQTAVKAALLVQESAAAARATTTTATAEVVSSNQINMNPSQCHDPTLKRGGGGRLSPLSPSVIEKRLESLRHAGYVAFQNRLFRDAVCGALAGGVSSLLTTPLDVIKTRLMTSAVVGSTALGQSSIPSATFISTSLSIWKEEGLLTFFRGATARLAHKIPANALFFLCYEASRAALGVKQTKS